MQQNALPIVAAGILPQGLSPADKSQLCRNCTAINGGTGVWQVTTNDPTITPGNSLLILSPGSGSNIPKGISFGQTAQAANVFLFTAYRNDTGAAVDVEVQFIIVRMPTDR